MVLEVARDTSSEPSKSPKAIATENKAARERLTKEIDSKMKQIWLTHSKDTPSKYLTEVAQLEKDIAKVRAMWYKSADITNIICSTDPVQAEAVEVAQKELETKMEKNFLPLGRTIRIFSIACHCLKEEAEAAK